jgi:O-antigen ligase
MLVLATGSFSMLGIMLLNSNSVAFGTPRIILWLAGLFNVFMLSTILFSGAPLNQQFWGSFGRNTGFLTYFSLMILVVALIWLRSWFFYKKLALILVLTSIPMTAYCLVQIAGKDPIPWSEFNTFGTLGNINFLSAFLGMTSIGALAFALNREEKGLKRIFLVALALLDLIIIYSTGSIQGPIIFAVGIAVLLFIFILDFQKLKMLFLSGFSLMSFAASYFVVIALQNKGPLASIIYQPSVNFRADYIHAGFEMTLLKPLFGVGMDSYGDWYREARGELSTLRTGPDRVANTAHNIFLDISSNGGILLGATYLSLVLIALFSGIKVLRTSNRQILEFKVIFSVWIAYQVQSLVSINQIGVGIWGWAFTGALIGMAILAKEAEQKDAGKTFSARSKELRGRPMSASNVLAGALGLAIGFTLSVIPLNADMKYREGSDRGNLGQLFAASKSLGATQFHRELVLDFALRNDRVAEVKEIASGLVDEYPRNFFGWKVLSVASASSDAERGSALQILRKLDPFNPDLR